MPERKKKRAPGPKKEAAAKGRKKKVLGRGLDALFGPDIGSIGSKDSDYFLCDISDIKPNPYQPRRKFASNELTELSLSIKEQGILQPLIVRKDKVGYELVAGERRLRAAKEAGLSQVPVVLRELTDKALLEISIVENIQRENLNPMEEADAYQRLMKEFNLTQDQVAKRVGKSRPAVANFLRLRQLPAQIKESLTQGKLSMGHARALLGAETQAQQLLAWKSVVAKGLSVRQTENLIRQIQKEKEHKRRPSDTTGDIYFEDIYYKDISENLSRLFGTKVLIKRKQKKGKIEIEFYGDEDLDRLLGLLKQP
jgi:ParB family chromosome partitioning protein